MVWVKFRRLMNTSLELPAEESDEAVKPENDLGGVSYYKASIKAPHAPPTTLTRVLLQESSFSLSIDFQSALRLLFTRKHT